MDTLVRIAGLSVDLPAADGPVRVIEDVSFDIPAGTTVGLIGETGSGKTMTAMAIIGLLPEGAVVTGEITFGGTDLVRCGEARLRALRGDEMSMIFQDPMASLNPTQRIGRQVGEVLRRTGRPRAEVRERVIDMLDRVGIPEPARRARDYPHELSGGLRQRAMIAMAMIAGPSLVLADEPTTALDVTVQARVLALLRKLQVEEGSAMLLVSHDLRVMSHVAQDLVVLYAGRVTERGAASVVLNRPAHPYTEALVRSVPAIRTRTAIADPLPGTSAVPAQRPSGCAFHPRCPLAVSRCRTDIPSLREVAPGRWSACHEAEKVLT
ncbi:ABC transporter ATP-binding protein [Kribbella italica]|uniref:Peptide/nickel transport system ATP-binding protein/oligopeptide transport system ATP-binding protein n=1 Tax=Kribbella italica TaxID=1540520 RepID=A0A7W9JFL3_9ACTN|nr:ABC transporter ATP-binding protein [Kribbella italica]MBB5840613.1 peptide/nickel transport system ATP-binding protein/oligopeptide transport system ATP-binding protein [Kribbella italica]